MKEFNKAVEEEGELFHCPKCREYVQKNFLEFSSDEKWISLDDKTYNDLFSEDDHEVIIKCKNCGYEFKLITDVITFFNYFEEGEEEKPLEPLDEFGHEIL